MKGVILAAGRGSRLGHLTSASPKCLTMISGRTLLTYQLEALRGGGCSEVGAVLGYQADKVEESVDFSFTNPEWASTNMVSSLECANDLLACEGAIVSYSDIVYSADIVSRMRLVAPHNDFAIAYDPDWLSLWQQRFEDPLVDAESFLMTSDGYLTEIGKKPQDLREIEGQYMGLLWFSAKGWEAVRKYRASLHPAERGQQSMTGLLNTLIQFEGARIRCVPNLHPWCEVDHESDIAVAESLIGW